MADPRTLIAGELYAAILHLKWGFRVNGAQTADNGVSKGDTLSLIDYYEANRRDAVAAGRPQIAMRWMPGLLWDADGPDGGCWRLTYALDRGEGATVSHVLTNSLEPVAVEYVDSSLVKLGAIPAHRGTRTDLVAAVNRFVNACLARSQDVDLTDESARSALIDELYADQGMQNRAQQIYEEYRKIRGLERIEIHMGPPPVKAATGNLGSWFPASIREAASQGADLGF